MKQGEAGRDRGDEGRVRMRTHTVERSRGARIRRGGKMKMDRML